MNRPRVVIVGGGFGGLPAARALRAAPVDVVLLDRSNHHLFQPLLYQVTTSVLAAGQIACSRRTWIARAWPSLMTISCWPRARITAISAMTDAEMIRNRILQAFERAEALDDPKRPDGLLTFVVGAEPTGVEIAGDCRSSSDRRLGRR